MGKQKQKPEHGYVQMSLFEFLGYGFEEDPEPPKPKPKKAAETEFVDRRTEWERFLDDNYMKGGMNIPDDDPLVSICSMLVLRSEANNKAEAKKMARKIASTATYHFANMAVGRYALTVKKDGGLSLVLISQKHILMITHVCESSEMIELLDGGRKVLIGAMNVKVFDTEGNIVNRYATGHEPGDIRQEACIDDWHMERFSENRLDEGKPVSQFYEVSFGLPRLVAEYEERGRASC